MIYDLLVGSNRGVFGKGYFSRVAEQYQSNPKAISRICKSCQEQRADTNLARTCFVMERENPAERKINLAPLFVRFSGASP